MLYSLNKVAEHLGVSLKIGNTVTSTIVKEMFCKGVYAGLYITGVDGPSVVLAVPNGDDIHYLGSASPEVWTTARGERIYNMHFSAPSRTYEDYLSYGFPKIEHPEYRNQLSLSAHETDDEVFLRPKSLFDHEADHMHAVIRNSAGDKVFWYATTDFPAVRPHNMGPHNVIYKLFGPRSDEYEMTDDKRKKVHRLIGEVACKNCAFIGDSPKFVISGHNNHCYLATTRYTESSITVFSLVEDADGKLQLMKQDRGQSPHLYKKMEGEFNEN